MPLLFTCIYIATIQVYFSCAPSEAERRSIAGTRYSIPIDINLSHRSRIPEGEGGWVYEQRLHRVEWDGPVLSP